MRPSRNNRSKNTYRERAEEKQGAFTDFGLSAFRFSDKEMKPTDILFWELIFDTLRHLGRLLTFVYKT